MRHLIIGGSIAAIKCAQKLRRLDPASEVTILSEEARPYAKMSLPYLLSGEITRRGIWLEVPEGTRFLGKQAVVRVLPVEKKVVNEPGQEFDYDRLLIASGASAQPPDFEGGASPGVFTVRNLADIAAIKVRLKKACHERVIISGAGLVSIETGDALLKLGFKPVFLISSNRVLSQILDEEASDIVSRDMVKKGAELYFGETIKRIRPAKPGIIVEMQSGKEFTGDLAIIGKGTTPNSGFLVDSGIAIDRGITVNEFMETSQKDIFAAGDVCQAYDLLWREKRVNAIWPVAIEQAKVAAMNMCHLAMPYEGSVSRNIVTAFGNTIFTLGLTSAKDGETYTRKGSGYARVTLREGKLAGAIFINVRVEPGAYLHAVQRQIDVSRLKDELVSGSFTYASLFEFLD